MILERPVRPNAAPILQESRTKLARRAANADALRPSGYRCVACGEERCDCETERAIHAAHRRPAFGWAGLASLVLPAIGGALIVWVVLTAVPGVAK